MTSETDEDPRAQQPGACRATTIGGTGIEWICIRPVHAKIYYRHSNGAPIFPSGSQHDGRPLQADRHLFVPRYPMRLRDRPEDAYITPEGSPLPGNSR